MRQNLRPHAGAGIGHRKPDVSAGRQACIVIDAGYLVQACRDGKAPAARHRIACVEGEIEQGRFQFARVGIYGRHVVGAFGRHADAFAERAAQHVAEVGQQLHRAHGARQQMLPPRERQQLAGEGGAALHCARCAFQGFQGGGVLRRFGFQQLQVAGDHGKQVVEIVRNAAGELAQRIQALRVRQLLLAASALDRHGQDVGDRLQELQPVPVEGALFGAGVAQDGDGAHLIVGLDRRVAGDRLQGGIAGDVGQCFLWQADESRYFQADVARIDQHDGCGRNAERGGDQLGYVADGLLIVRGFQQPPADLRHHFVETRTFKRLACALRFGDVANRRGIQRAVRGGDRAQPDFDRKRLPIRAHAGQFVTRAHRAHARAGHVMRAMRDIRLAHPRGHQRLHRQAGELAAVVTEQAFGVRVGQHDHAAHVHHHHGVGRRFEQRAEQIGVGRVLGKHVIAHKRCTVGENR